MAAPSSKVRRMSVLEDLDSRIDALRMAADQVETRELDRLTSKSTIVEFLSVSRVALNMLSKIESMRVRFAKLAASRQDNLSMLKIDRATLLTQDDYVRTVGVFSNALSPEDLVSRALKMPPQIASDTVTLVRTAAAYTNAFYKPKPSKEPAQLYTQMLVDFDPNITLLHQLDYARLRTSLMQLSPEDVNHILLTMRLCLPMMKKSSVQSIWKKAFQSTDKVKLVLILVRNYVALITEIHGNRSANTFPSSTALYPILNDAARKELSDPAQYIQEANRSERAKASMQMMLTLCSALVRSLAILAAFRTILYATELQHEKLDWCLLDMPDRKQLDKYISSLLVK